MRRVIIIGSPGAGKSTFARRLSAKTGLTLHYLDMIWHRADRTTISREEFDRRLQEIMAEDEWIIDGNYLRTLPMRLAVADTVFFFDLPVEVCLKGAEERLGRERPDMPWHDTKLDVEFRQWIIDFPSTNLPVIQSLLDAYTGHIIRFATREEADSYLSAISAP